VLACLSARKHPFLLRSCAACSPASQPASIVSFCALTQAPARLLSSSQGSLSSARMRNLLACLSARKHPFLLRSRAACSPAFQIASIFSFCAHAQRARLLISSQASSSCAPCAICSLAYQLASILFLCAHAQPARLLISSQASLSSALTRNLLAFASIPFFCAHAQPARLLISSQASIYSALMRNLLACLSARKHPLLVRPCATCSPAYKLASIPFFGAHAQPARLLISSQASFSFALTRNLLACLSAQASSSFALVRNALACVSSSQASFSYALMRNLLACLSAR
jgi:hypothetical protein